MQTVHWSEGLWVGPEHFELQSELHRREWMRIERWSGQGAGLWKVEWDSEAWERGILRWNCLMLRDESGRTLEQTLGMRTLEPPYLTMPVAEPGGLESCVVYVWYTGVERDMVTQWQERDITVRYGEWSQGWEVPAGVDALGIVRWHRVGSHWELDHQMMPALLRMDSCPQGQRLLQDIQHAVVTLHGMGCAHPDWQRQLIATHWQLSHAGCWGMLQLRNLLWSLLAGQSQATCMHVPGNMQDLLSRQLVTLTQTLREWAQGGTQERRLLRATLLRNGPAWFAVQITALDWKDKSVELVWSRPQTFHGEEASAVRCASLLSLSKLVRAALPGIPWQSRIPTAQVTGLASLVMRMDRSHSLWQEVLQSGSFAVHCVAAGEQDHFELREVAP